VEDEGADSALLLEAPVELAAAELPAAVEILAAAFRDNPLNVAVIGEPARRRLRANRAGNRASLQSVHGVGLCLGAYVQIANSEGRTRKLAGVLVAEPPGIHPLPPPAVSTQLRVLWEQGWRVATGWSRVHFELQNLHPRNPHWVLDLLGVAPEFQRQGVGSLLLATLLKRIDAEQASCFLETDRRENVAFYRRASYTVLSEERCAGVPVWRMWREPRRRE